MTAKQDFYRSLRSKVAAMLFGRKGRNQQHLPKANAAITGSHLAAQKQGRHFA